MAPRQLSPSTFLYPPSPGAERTGNTSQPHCILLATWAFAKDSHISKYVDQYRARFPGASILVAKCFMRHFFWHPAARRDLKALTGVIRSILDAADAEGEKYGRPRLLLHVFSTGGISTTYYLHHVYEQEDQKHQPVPQHVTIFDSTPGRSNYRSAAEALQFGTKNSGWAQKTVAVPLAHVLTSCLWIANRLSNREDLVDKWAGVSNNPAHKQETCRSYVYSRADRIVESWVVEAHAAEARSRGFSVVHTADFGDKSAHVAHARTDPRRYWAVVTSTWEAATKI